jgi:uncharacterized protein YcnI
MQKTLQTLLMMSIAFAALSAVSEAHVLLNPSEAVPGDQIYTVTVPTEKNIPTVGLTLEIPGGIYVSGIQAVSGWNYTVKKESVNITTDDGVLTERITEITWSGGQILPDEFMVFPVSTMYIGDPAVLVWKTYQKYADGSVVAWDDTLDSQPAPKVTILKEGKIDALTNTVNNLSSSVSDLKSSSPGSTATWISVGAFLMAFASLIIAARKG